MVGLAALRWILWTTRNKVTFDNHVLRSPLEVVRIMRSFLLSWAGPQNEDGKMTLNNGATEQMNKALALMHGEMGISRAACQSCPYPF